MKILLFYTVSNITSVILSDSSCMNNSVSFPQHSYKFTLHCGEKALLNPLFLEGVVNDTTKSISIEHR